MHPRSVMEDGANPLKQKVLPNFLMQCYHEYVGYFCTVHLWSKCSVGRMLMFGRVKYAGTRIILKAITALDPQGPKWEEGVLYSYIVKDRGLKFDVVKFTDTKMTTQHCKWVYTTRADYGRGGLVPHPGFEDSWNYALWYKWAPDWSQTTATGPKSLIMRRGRRIQPHRNWLPPLHGFEKTDLESGIMRRTGPTMCTTVVIKWSPTLHEGGFSLGAKAQIL